MAQLFKNNAYSALAASLTNVATTLTVTTGQGDRFPAVTAPDFFMLTLQDASNNIEIVKVTARTAGADAMTIVRAQEGTTARAWNIGDVSELRLTAFGLNPLALLEGSATAAAIRSILDVPTRTGGDASGTWSINITGSAGSATGNAGTATALQTARNINGTSFNGSADITTDNWGTSRTITIGGTGKSVNGSANVSWSLAEIGAADASTTVYTSGDQSIGGVKNFNGAYTAFNGVSGNYNGQVYIGGAQRHLRSVTASNSWEFVNADNTAVIFTFANNGDFTAAGNVTAYSDERLKKNWSVLPVDFIDRLATVKHGTYTRIDTEERQAGSSAQEWRDLLPEVVLEDQGGQLSLAYGNAALVSVIALAQRVVSLEARLKELEGR